MEIGLSHYVTLAAILFTIGIAGIILNHKNIIIILMSVELILLAVNINLVAVFHPIGRSDRPSVRSVHSDGGNPAIRPAALGVRAT